MEQFHIVLKDYANWKMDNIETIEKLRGNDSLLYRRFEPVYKVLNNIYERAVEEETLSDDMRTIFQVGFNYLHMQFEVVRIYFEKLFESDCEAFEKYTPLIGYLLYIADVRSDLEDYEDSVDFSELNDVETLIENMIAEKDPRFDYAEERLYKAVENIKGQLDFEYVGVVDIFVEIAGNLGVELSKRDPFVIGEEV